MGEETVRVDPNEDLDTLIARLKQSRSKDVVLVLPAKQRALQTLDNFYALRKAAREDGLNLTFSGGNKTLKGLAKLLGFRVEGGEDGEDAEMAEFTAGATEQITMPPTSQSRTAAFDGPPAGFVSQPPPGAPPMRNGNGNGAGRGEAMPPPTMPGNAEDFFNSIQDMSIPSIQPPPARNDNGFGGGDQVLNRNNAANVFGMPGAAPNPSPASPPPAIPRAEFDFGGGGSGEGSTMSYEQAMQSGFFDNATSNNLSNDFQFDATPTEPPLLDDDDVAAVPPIGSDNAADRFRRRGVRGEEDFEEPISRGRGGRAPRVKQTRTTSSRGRLAMPPALAGLGTRVNKILNPVERTGGSGGGMMRPDLSPAERERRTRQASRNTFFALIAAAVVVVLVILAIVLSLGNNNNGTVTGNGPLPQTTNLNLVYKTTPVNNTVAILLDTTTPPGTAGQTNPGTAAAGTDAGTGGRLPVSQISSGAITTKSDYPAFGSKMQPTGTAQGNVTIINASTQAVGYGAGQVLYTAPNGVSYRLRDAVSIPAGNPLAGTQGRSGGVVVADRAGSVGNLDKGFTRYLSNAVVAQAGAITGGNEQPVKVVSPDDINGLKKMLMDQAQTQAQTSLKDRYNPATQDIVVINNGEPNCTTTKNAGDVADTFSGSCTINPQVYVYNKSDLQKAVQDQLVTDPKLKVDPSSIQLKGSAQLKNENNRLMLQVPVAGTTYTPVDLGKLKTELAGKTVAEAQQIVSTNYPQIDRLDFSNVKDKLPEANLINFVTSPGGEATPAANATPGAGATAAAGVTPGAAGVAPTVTPKA